MLRIIVARILGLINRRKSEEAFEEEASEHLELLTERFIAQGMSAEEARHAARRQFGGVGQLHEALRDQRSFPIIDSLRQDLGVAFRQLRTAPRFTFAAAAILALGIGASTSTFMVVNAVLIRPLPYPESDRLVWVGEVLKRNTTDEVTLTPNFLDWRRRNQVFSGMAAFNPFSRTLLADGEATPLKTLKASASLLPVLAAQPLLGRPFLASEDRKGQDRVAILAHGLWLRAFGGDPSIIGQPITLDDGTYSVVGVLPESFHFPTLEPIDLITPLGKNEELELTRADGTTTIVRNVIARLKPGVTLEQARAEMEVIEASLAPPSFFRGVQMSVKVISLQEKFTGGMRYALLMLFGAVGCILLLACANVANLLLGRGETRRKEMGIRAALGASRGRIIQQLLVESLVLALLGVGAGLLLAFWARGLLLPLLPQTLPLTMSLPIDSRVLNFAVLSGLATALASGLGPAFASAAPSLIFGRQKWLNALASLQMAIAIVLLTGGGLMLQRFWKMRYQNLGFSPDRMITAGINLSRARHPDISSQIAFLDAALDKLKSMPGVDGAGLGVLPPGEGHATNGFGIEGRQWPPNERRPVARQYSVSPGYFRMLGVPLQSGREVEPADNSTAVPIALISEAFARSQFPAENPIGRRVRFEANTPWRTIVGVVADVKTAGLASTPELAIYVPYRQSGLIGGGGAGFLIRTALPLASVAPEIRRQVALVGPQQPVTSIQMFETRLNESVAGPRLAAFLLGGFAALALLLAAAGLYSVMFVLVRSRFREIGIRLAMGGRPRDMVWLTLGHSLRVMAAGLAVGSVGAVWLSRSLKSMWYGVSALDPATLAASSILLILAGLAASGFPARQASRIDPMEVLRGD
jgi:predicted permease